MIIEKQNMELILKGIMNIRGYIQAEFLDREHPDLFNMAVELENKIAELAGDEEL